jgi:hypothetical protein
MTCPTCKKEFPTEQEMKAHQSAEHGGNRDAAPDREHRFWRKKGE